jgi:hypothetical protein
MAPDDGRVVALTHGCGAHSEVVVETQESTYSGMAVEDDEFEVLERPLVQDDEVVATVDAPEDAGVPASTSRRWTTWWPRPRTRRPRTSKRGRARRRPGGRRDGCPGAVLGPRPATPRRAGRRPGRRRERLTRSTPVRPSAAPRALPALAQAADVSRAEPTPDGRYVVIDGRRWRATDPDIPEDAAAPAPKVLMSARRDVGSALRAKDAVAEKAARSRVHAAKTALGERGTPWWEQSRTSGGRVGRPA